MLEALIPAIIEQRVPGADAFRSWRLLVSKYGTPAPGPAPAGMRVPPSAHVWRHIPSWEFHRANVDPRRAQTVVTCARRAASLERLVSRPTVQAREALMSLPGVGEWTAAETAQRAFGDADAVSVGDYHIPENDRLDACWAGPSTTRACSNCSRRCDPIASAWSGCSKPADWPTNPAAARGYRCSKSTRFESLAFFSVAIGYPPVQVAMCEPWKEARKQAMTQFTIPGLTDKQAARLAELLQKQLSTYNDLHLTLKHIHWNVVGPNFIGVHEMIDPQVDTVRGFADDVAERIAALGASPQGTPGAIIKDRSWDDYSVGRDTVQAHLAALDLVYNGVIEDIRQYIDETDELDQVTQDLLIGQAGQLEKFQWFVRAHLESAGGKLAHQGKSTEKAAASSARGKS